MAKTNVVVKPVFHGPQHFVNVASSTDAQLRAALATKGINVDRRTGRIKLIGLCKDHGLWDFKGDVIPPKYKARYGKKQRCGDEISEALHSATRDGKGNVDPDALHTLQVDNEIDGSRWDHCNIGQKVMNTSNVLRAKYKRGEQVIIAGIKHKLPDAE